MPDKKDLVDAYSYGRRRLVTAFVSGAPGGREVTPTRTGRTVLAGVALAVLLLAGAAVAGVFKDQSDVDWSEPALITDSGTGALYVNLGDLPGDVPGLRAVANVTSAQLILGSDAKPVEVPSEEIADRDKGPAIGIVGAPATVPPRRDLVPSGWTACTGTGSGIAVTVAENPAVTTAPEAGLVVRSGEATYLIATAPGDAGGTGGAYRYRFPDGPNQALYGDLGVAIQADAIRVSAAWLDLFPEGGTLDASGLRIDGGGDPVPRTGRFAGYPADARIGDYIVDGGRSYVITREGPVIADPFPLAVLQNTEYAGRLPQQVELDDDVDLRFVRAPYAASHWPEGLPEDPGQSGATPVCAVLSSAAGRAPSVEIGLEPDESVAAAGDTTVANVEAGHGAMVRSADWGSSSGGAPYLVDDRGISYRLLDRSAIENLGYADVEPIVVPDVWLKIFEPGVGLSRDAALCPPETDVRVTPCS